jgi:hypothetical protein
MVGHTSPTVVWFLHLPGYIPLILLLGALPLCASAAALSAVQGEDIPLRGTAPGSTYVYLFLTGPNLPPDGISLATGAPVTTGASGSFTRVVVSTDGTWAYTWRTGSLGRVLDPGTYVIYITLEPRSRPDLDDSVYKTQPVSFGRPAGTIVPANPRATETTPSETVQGGPVMTGMESPSPMATATEPPSPTRPEEAALPAPVPLGAAALAFLVARRRH